MTYKMEPYHKIQTLFKREQVGKNKGKMIEGSWTTPELGYLADNQWEFTEKVDGTNIRVGLTLAGDTLNVEYAGRSNNAVIPTGLLQHLEQTFPTHPLWRRDLQAPAYGSRYNDILDWMKNEGLESVVLFGEGYGAKIQGGGKYREDPSFVLFDVKIGNWWLTRPNVDDIAAKLGIDSVPTIGYGTLHDAIDIVSTGITFGKGGQPIRWGRGGLQSKWGDFEAEGLVCRPVVPLFNRRGERIICKVKSVDFK